MSEDLDVQWVSMNPGTTTLPLTSISRRAAVFAERSDDAVVADRDVALDQLAADEIEDPPALQHHVRRVEPLPLLDGADEERRWRRS